MGIVNGHGRTLLGRADFARQVNSLFVHLLLTSEIGSVSHLIALSRREYYRIGESGHPRTEKISTVPRFSDRVFRVVVFCGGLSALLILAAIAIFLGIRGFSILSQTGLRFVTQYEWYSAINTDGTAGEEGSTFGIGAMLIGTIITALIAVVIGVPIAVASALFLNFYAPNSLRGFLVAVIDLMAAFPSILFGLWAFNILMPSGEYWAKILHKYLGFVPFFDVSAPVFTRSPFIAGIVLAIMIIPIVTSVSREVFSQTPLDRIQAAYALGATKWTMIKAVVLPFGSSGIVGGAMLGSVERWAKLLLFSRF